MLRRIISCAPDRLVYLDVLRRSCSMLNDDSFLLTQFKEKYLNQREVSFTEHLHVFDPNETPTLPIYRVTNSKGRLINESLDHDIKKDLGLKMYKNMISVNQMDRILYDSQRQGRITFYMTSYGEEGSQIGSAAALGDDDLIYGQYREMGVLHFRGFTVPEIMNQCYGNAKDGVNDLSDIFGKGKQMPVHYGSRKLNFVTISSSLATQMPQAVGSAYAFKRDNTGRVVVVYFGDGAASEGDAYTSFNFAATLQCPIVFFCRNNGYAISTPTSEQYGGDGIAGKAAGFGLSSIRVDGSDTLAVYNATRAARKIAAQNKPVLVEAMSYRVGHHSTSDDSAAYRSSEEVQSWQERSSSIERFKAFLVHKGWWTYENERELRTRTKKNVMAALEEAGKVQKLHPFEMFEDVYKELPANLLKQRDVLHQHLKAYGNKYPLKDFEATFSGKAVETATMK